MNVSVNQELCIGCELCVATCDNVFHMEQGLARAKHQPGDSLPERDCVLAAAEECPTSAIQVSQ